MYSVHVCVWSRLPVCGSEGWDEGVSQVEGQAENEGDRQIHRGDMHTKKRWIWTNTTLIMASMLGCTINMIVRLLPAYTCLCIISTYIYMYMYYIYMSSLVQ